MENREIIILVIVLLIAVFSIFFLNITGNIILEDQFSQINGTHWTHIPITYSIAKNCSQDLIKNAFSIIQKSTNNLVYFNQIEINPDINISCSFIDNCYQNSTRRSWFWIIKQKQYVRMKQEQPR
jgi:hypothetical protein